MNGCYDILSQKDYDFAHFINRNPEICDLDKVDFILTYRMMKYGIPSVDFQNYSLDELMLCTMVMRPYSFTCYRDIGPFLCNEQVIRAVMRKCENLEKQMQVYEEDLLDYTLCLKHFLERLDMSKIDGNSQKFQCILSALLSIVQKYNSVFVGSAYRKKLDGYENR